MLFKSHCNFNDVWLQQIVQAKGYTVKPHTIILASITLNPRSIGGIFIKPMHEVALLGVNKDRCKTLKRKLHTHSIKWLHTIILKRRLLEHNKVLYGISTTTP